MIERIKELLNEKEWTFASLLNMEEVVEEISTTIYNEMSPEQKLVLVWSDTTYQELMGKISLATAELVKEELMQAKVSFGEKRKNENKEDNKNEISERSMGRKSSEERSTDETADSEE
tara:strand:+ start:13995 stop:14348 length:354 start_codon:yes stop_codon:yes gene_type:complete